MEEKTLDSMADAAQVDNETLFPTSQEGVTAKVTGSQIIAYAGGGELDGDIPEVAPKESTIGALPASTRLNDYSLFLVEQQGEAKKATGAQLKEFVGSGGGGGTYDSSDPEAVYNVTRPSDWLKMPTPGENEIYMLVLIADGASEFLAFTVSLQSGGNYTVELGTVSDGAFTASSSAEVASGARYDAELLASDFEDLTSDGYKQCMVKVSGTAESPITSFAFNPSSYRGGYYWYWNVVDMACNMPSCASLTMCNDSESYVLFLRYFAWYGQNALTSTSRLFGYCKYLKAVLSFDLSNVTDAGKMFEYCYSLEAVPEWDFSDGQTISMSYMFQYCYGMKKTPRIHTGAGTTFQYGFYYCYGLKEASGLDFGSGGDVKYLFAECRNLQKADGIVIGTGCAPAYMFNYCYSMQSAENITVESGVDISNLFYYSSPLACVSLLMKPGASSISLYSNALRSLVILPGSDGWSNGISAGYGMGHDAMVTLFESLPEVTGSHSLYLSYNPSASRAALTDEEKAIATNKGWTLTV